MEICMFYKHAGSRKGSQPENQSSIKTLSVSSSSSTGETSNEIFGKKTDLKKKSVLDSKNEYNEPIAIISQNIPTTPPYQRLTNALQTDPRCAHEVALGRRVGLYRFCGDIGRGNFSKVKLGVHQLTRDKVAIKVVDRGGLDARALRMLSREVATLECVHHPNILRLFEVVETLGRVYLITEWIRGGEMYNHITQGGPIREIHASPLFKQLLLAVKHMHSLGFVHRDIKAENVLLVSENRLILADFGFSTELINGQNQKLDTFCGSPPYAAPELFSDDHYIGGPVDIWALGVLLYFMVVGNMPFRAPTVPSLRSAVLKGEYTLPGHVSLPCQRLIQRILVHIPAQRPTIDEMLSCQWIINPNLSLELMTREINLHAKTIKKSSNFWFHTKPRHLQRNFSIRDRYLEITNKPPLQICTKKSIDNINDNFLHPIELLHEHPQLFSDGTQGTIPRKSFFGGTLKKKISPMEDNKQQSPAIYKNGEIRLGGGGNNDDQQKNNDSPPLQQQQQQQLQPQQLQQQQLQQQRKNYDEEKGKFIMLPTDTDDLKILPNLELEAREILIKLGVTSEMLRESIKNGPRSDIIGAYRIVINRLQKQSWLAKREQVTLSQLIDSNKKSKRNRGCTLL